MVFHMNRVYSTWCLDEILYVETYDCFGIPNSNTEDYKFVFIVRTTELLLNFERSFFVIHHLEMHVQVRFLVGMLFDSHIRKYL